MAQFKHLLIIRSTCPQERHPVKESHRRKTTRFAARSCATQARITLQLSNFWRDIGEDWRIGRVYLPLEDMQYFRYSEEDLAAKRININLIHLLEFEFERTESYYITARESVQMLASGQVAVMSALEIYRAILQDIRNNRYNVFTRRAGTGSLKKLDLVAKAFLLVRQ